MGQSQIEFRVFELASLGKSPSEIATALGLDLNTINVHYNSELQRGFRVYFAKLEAEQDAEFQKETEAKRKELEKLKKRTEADRERAERQRIKFRCYYKRLKKKAEAGDEEAIRILENRRAKVRVYCEKYRREAGIEPRTFYTPEQKRERKRLYAKERYWRLKNAAAQGDPRAIELMENLRISKRNSYEKNKEKYRAKKQEAKAQAETAACRYVCDNVLLTARAEGDIHTSRLHG